MTRGDFCDRILRSTAVGNFSLAWFFKALHLAIAEVMPVSLSESQLTKDGLHAGADAKGVISDFYSWIRNIPDGKYQYMVVATRRASNLLETVRKEYPDVLQDYITENALLLQVERVADFYKETGAFPVIAILDDILVYGRNMNLLLTQFWNAVRQRLAHIGVDAEAKDVEEAFSRSVSLWIYGVNDAPILLRHEFQRSMHCRKMQPVSQWRRLSDSIAKSIAAEDVANTSYVISAWMKPGPDRYRPRSALWITDDSLWYRGNRQRYSFSLFRAPSENGVYPTVRSYIKKDRLCFTPYFFTPELDAGQIFQLLKTLFSFSLQQDPQVTYRCINLLNRIKECQSRLMVYAQFAILLLSQVTLSVFFEDLEPELEEQLDYDSGKISRNFGPEREIGPVLRDFCRIRWKESQLEALLNCLDFPDRETSEKAELPDLGDAEAASWPEKRNDDGRLVNTMERLAYKQAVDHERDAAQRQQYAFNDVSTNSVVNRTGEQELGQFLLRVKEQTGVRSNAESMLPVLSCLTQMMDLGDISLKARSKRRDGNPVFYSSVRTTEMSLAIMPRKLSVYYQPFFLLAQLYWRDEDFPDRVERYFRDTLFEGDPENKNAALISNARYFAQLIIENRIIVDSMLNWRSLPELSELSES